MEFDEIFVGDNNKMTALSVCRAADTEVLEPVLRIIRETGATCHLVDDRNALEQSLDMLQPTEAVLDRLVLHHIENDGEAAKVSLGLVADGSAGILMKGLVSTAILLKEVLNKDHGLIQDALLSHVALFDVPNYHKALILSDAAMNIAPDMDGKAGIMDNAVAIAHRLGIEKPKVALLSAVEKTTDKMPSTVDAAGLVRQEGRFIAEGPLQYDLAVSEQAARHKGIDSAVAGDADVLIAPNIEAGNILYKSLVYSAGARVASLITGASVPIVLTSRADSAEDRYNSIRFAMKASK